MAPVFMCTDERALFARASRPLGLALLANDERPAITGKLLGALAATRAGGGSRLRCSAAMRVHDRMARLAKPHRTAPCRILASCLALHGQS